MDTRQSNLTYKEVTVRKSSRTSTIEIMEGWTRFSTTLTNPRAAILKALMDVRAI